MPIMTCLFCSKQFTIADCRIKAGRGKYCSHACQMKARHRAGKLCVHCGQPISNSRPASIFCSQQCSSRHMHTSKKLKLKKCTWCGGEFTPLALTDKFCSRLCEAKDNLVKKHTTIMHDPWRDGLIKPDRFEKDTWRAPDAVLGF